MLKGIAASQGIAIAKVYKLQQPVLKIEKKQAVASEEVAKLTASCEKTFKDIELIKERASANLSPEELAVFDAHLMMANDPDLKDQMVAMINTDSFNA